MNAVDPKDIERIYARENKSKNPILENVGPAQFSRGESYALKQVDSISVVSLNGMTASEINGEEITFEFSGNQVYEELGLQIDWKDATDCTNTYITQPIRRMTIINGTSDVTNFTDSDYVLAYKMMSREGRLHYQDLGNFTREAGPGIAARRRVIPLFTPKWTGYSEDVSTESSIVVAKNVNIKFRITLQNPFVVDGVPFTDEPKISKIKVKGFMRHYTDKKAQARIIDNYYNQGGVPQILYEGIDLVQIPKTTDATGGINNLTLSLSGLENSHVIMLVVRAIKDGSHNFSASPFDFTEASGIYLNTGIWREFRNSDAAKSLFYSATGRTISYSDDTIEDGDLILLSSPQSPFELSRISPDYYKSNTSPTLKFMEITGLVAATKYTFIVTALRIIGRV